MYYTAAGTCTILQQVHILYCSKYIYYTAASTYTTVYSSICVHCYIRGGEYVYTVCTQHIDTYTYMTYIHTYTCTYTYMYVYIYMYV